MKLNLVGMHKYAVVQNNAYIHIEVENKGFNLREIIIMEYGSYIIIEPHHFYIECIDCYLNKMYLTNYFQPKNMLEYDKIRPRRLVNEIVLCFKEINNEH